MEYLIQLGIQGLKRVLETKNFTTSAAMQQELEEYEERNNPLLMFVKDLEDEDFELENELHQRFMKDTRNSACQNPCRHCQKLSSAGRW